MKGQTVTARKKGAVIDVMSSPVFSLDFGTPLRDAARKLVDRQISGAPVLGENGELLGVVSLFDIVTCLAGLELPPGARGGFYSYEYPGAEGGAEEWEGEIRKGEENPLEEECVDEIMTRQIISVTPDTPLEKVARKMVKEHIHRVLVMEKDQLVGVISTMDVLGCLA